MFQQVRDAYREWSLHAGTAVLLAYAAAGALIGFELFAFLVIWPVGITTLIAVLVVGKLVVRRRARSSR